MLAALMEVTNSMTGFPIQGRGSQTEANESTASESDTVGGGPHTMH